MAAYVYENGHRKYVRGSRSDADRKYFNNWNKARRAGDPQLRKRESKKQRDWQKAHPLEFGWYNCRRSAKVRGYEWTLNQETFNRLLLADCSYCGVAPNPVNGIDRRDNSLGYTTENSVSACSDCNYAKRKMSAHDFLSWASRVASYKGE